jgi:hypothetical protein
MLYALNSGDSLWCKLSAAFYVRQKPRLRVQKTEKKMLQNHITNKWRSQDSRLSKPCIKAPVTELGVVWSQLNWRREEGLTPRSHSGKKCGPHLKITKSNKGLGMWFKCMPRRCEAISLNSSVASHKANFYISLYRLRNILRGVKSHPVEVDSRPKSMLSYSKFLVWWW